MSIEIKPKAAISLFEDHEEKTEQDAEGKPRKHTIRKLLCVYSRRHNAWMLPGSDGVEGFLPPETEGAAQARILLKETGLRTTERVKLYDGPNGVIFLVAVEGTSKNTGFLTREEFLFKSPFRPFYEKLFRHLDSEEASHSRVTVRAKSGRVLYSYITESYRKNSEGEMGWWLDQPEYLHAPNLEAARIEVQSMGILTTSRRLKEIAMAIGYKVEKESSKGKVLVA